MLRNCEGLLHPTSAYNIKDPPFRGFECTSTHFYLDGRIAYVEDPPLGVPSILVHISTKVVGLRMSCAIL
eukprot:216537-Ditylum_brightwellii.AAC.1